MRGGSRGQAAVGRPPRGLGARDLPSSDPIPTHPQHTNTKTHTYTHIHTHTHTHSLPPSPPHLGHGDDVLLGQRGRQLRVLLVVEVDRLDHHKVVPVDLGGRSRSRSRSDEIEVRSRRAGQKVCDLKAVRRPEVGSRGGLRSPSPKPLSPKPGQTRTDPRGMNALTSWRPTLQPKPCTPNPAKP